MVEAPLYLDTLAAVRVGDLLQAEGAVGLELEVVRDLLLLINQHLLSPSFRLVLLVVPPHTQGHADMPTSCRSQYYRAMNTRSITTRRTLAPAPSRDEMNYSV